MTGAGGFLGSAISYRLDEGGWQVVGAGRPEVEIPSLQFDRLLAATAPDLIVHCAGPASVPASVEDPARDREGSVGVMQRLLEVIGELDRRPRVLHLSSAAIYGNPGMLPISESQPAAPVSPYGHHRAACEALLADAAAGFGLQSAVMRIFSAYGRGLRRQILWDATRRGIETGRIDLGGTGRESRDFIHADDVARATLAITANGDFEGEAYNVASGEETTIAELACLIAASLELDEEAISFSGRARSGDPINWRADITRLNALGFEPSIALADGVADYVGWARNPESVRPA